MRILFFIISVILFTSCTEVENPINYTYRMDNMSSHEIALVATNINGYSIPDSVIIESGNRVEWLNIDGYRGIFIPFTNSDPIKIYYDGKVVKIFEASEYLRNPLYRNNWIMADENKKKKERLMVYTFTEEDYQLALEENQQEWAIYTNQKDSLDYPNDNITIPDATVIEEIALSCSNLKEVKNKLLNYYIGRYGLTEEMIDEYFKSYNL